MIRRGGPTLHRRLNSTTVLEQAQRVAELRHEGLGYRDIAGNVGMSPATCWRRYWWLQDWTLPELHGRPRGPVPAQRHTSRNPTGDRPCRPTLDHPELAPPVSLRCGARCRTRDGAPCRAWAVRGGRRCRMHGGASPQAERAARTRLLRARAMANIVQRVHADQCERGERTAIEWRTS